MKFYFSMVMAVFFLVSALPCRTVGQEKEKKEELKTIKLPAPVQKGGMPLMQALKNRRTTREFNSKEIPEQVLSNLLWAAFGINRSDGKRTAPSARNWQEIDIYVANKKGLYLYDAQNNTLNPVLPGDIRSQVGKQAFHQTVPVDLIYVANFSRMKGADQKSKTFYSAADTGFISQNVYLFCASQGLVTVVCGLVDREKLGKTMKLKKDQKVILVQPVGYPM